MEELMNMLMQYQQENQSGGRFGLNLNPISDIGHFKVSPTRGYLAQDGGIIQEQQPPFPGTSSLPMLPSVAITSQYPMSLEQGGTVDTINRVPTNVGAGIAGQYMNNMPLSITPPLPLSGEVFGQSLVPNHQIGGVVVSSPASISASQYSPIQEVNIPQDQQESLYRVLSHWKWDQNWADKMKNKTGSDIIKYRPVEGLKGEELEKAQQYNLSIEKSGLLGKPWAQGLNFYMMAERNGALKEPPPGFQFGGLIQAPTPVQQEPVKYIPISANPTVHLPFQFEQDGDDARFRKVKTRGLTGQQKVEDR